VEKDSLLREMDGNGSKETKESILKEENERKEGEE